MDKTDLLILNNKAKKKNFLQIIIDLSFIFLKCLFFAVILLYLVYLIPTNLMTNNVKKSNDILVNEGDYYTFSIFGYVGVLDNFTDSIMIDNAYFDSGELTTLEQSMKNQRYGTSVSGLDNLINNREDKVISYQRYWHGYLIFLKPLLLVFSLQEIRIINLILQSLIVVLNIFLMYKKKKILILPYIISLIAISPFVTFHSLQYSTVYYLFNIAILFILYNHKNITIKNYYGYFFFIIGILTSFFDFLTYPIATLGMPLIVALSLLNNKTLKENVIFVLKMSLFWILGYACFWGAKWIIASVVCHQNLISDALISFADRISGSAEAELKTDISWLQLHLAFLKNIYRIMNIVTIFMFILLIIAILLFNIFYRQNIKFSKVSFITYFVVLLLPVLWQIIVANHSYIHIFTCRSYVVSIFAFYMILLSMIDFNKKNETSLEIDDTNEEEKVTNFENNNKKIAVIIPCYNEHLTIVSTVKRYKEALPEADIYVYDNNSTDGSDKLALEAGAIVKYEKKQGKGNVVKSMFNEIDADCYFMVDADDTYMTENVREMCDLVLSGKADMVNGDRLSSTYFTEEKRHSHKFGNRIVRFLINFLYHNKIRDIMTGQRAFSKRFVKSFDCKSKGFEIETEMTIFACDNDMVVKEIPCKYVDRPKGSFSKLDTYKDGIKVLKTIAKMFFNIHPREFLGYVSCAFLGLGLVLLIPSFILSLKAVKNIALMILWITFFALFLMCNCTGIILGIIKKKKTIN